MNNLLFLFAELTSVFKVCTTFFDKKILANSRIIWSYLGIKKSAKSRDFADFSILLIKGYLGNFT
ncbi:hypothetical protein B0A62_03900 [Flavobacterium hydatis]|uniref:Transposase n=1 Tax=Flavobacterium hydatis TaxID=991 RepID=A0ABX4CJN8_FLAHY|nr:hypothetical protein B0A62_03900 [Flavobacterium hydatis]